MSHLYSFASLGGIECGAFRLRGVGLANCLFPWARCAVASKRYGLERIASTWPQLCHRQWLRWDRDKRCYFGLFDEGDDVIRGPRKIGLLAAKPRINEHDFLADPAKYSDGVVVFSGIDGYFQDLLGEHEEVRRMLIAATKPGHKRALERDAAPEIFVHIRYGDAVPADTPKGRSLKIRYHLRQPMSWFIHVVNELRGQVGACVPVRVFSDASDAELGPLLALSEVTRMTFGSSIADLLALSTAKVLVASGSTFSMWASYLGRMPVIWPAGQRRQRLHGSAWEYEIELDHDPLPDVVAGLIRQRLSGMPAAYSEARL